MHQVSRKRYHFDTHRLRDPKETLALARPHFAQMGITRIANLTGLDRIGLPTVMVTRPNSRSVAVALGKGLSLDAAEASGVMEAIETWHAEQIILPVRSVSFEDLRHQASVVDIAGLPKVTDGQFDAYQKMLWIEGQDLLGETARWIPYEMIDTDYTCPPHGGQGAFPRTTNGLASGNDLLEATCHAICELIERDATTLWHFGPQKTRINPKTVNDARCKEALARFSNANINVGIWDTTTDVGVASFHCVICEANERPGHIGIGDGSHPDRAIALLRALTEAAQTRLTYVSGARDDLDPEEFTSAALADKERYVRELIDHSVAQDNFSDCPTNTTESFRDDLTWLLERLASAGIEQVLTVDLSRDDIGFAVVRAVIPGLEAPHDDPNFLAGSRALGSEAACG